jgi:hypothetical protein
MATTNRAALRLLETEAQKQTKTILEVIEFTQAEAKAWKSPSFQRPLKVNSKVEALAAEIKKSGGVIPGVLTFGIVAGEKFLVDGQHRREAFALSGCEVGYADARSCVFSDEAEMGQEFVDLNSSLVRLKPDDVLRGLEKSYEPLAKLRRSCPFVGYGMFRMNDSAPILSMSTALRCWFGSAPEVPVASTSGIDAARSLTDEEVKQLGKFLGMAYDAWGRTSDASKLWNALNLMVVMWLYRRVSLAPAGPKIHRMSADEFGVAMVSLLNSRTYVEFLAGRALNERNRSPAYARVKALFANHVAEKTGKRPALPQPSWAQGH